MKFTNKYYKYTNIIFIIGLIANHINLSDVPVGRTYRP